jgi:hypothetical protein
LTQVGTAGRIGLFQFYFIVWIFGFVHHIWSFAGSAQ